MEVAETVVLRAATQVIDSPGVRDPAWFAARQPGIVKYLETRCAPGTDVCGVALLGALTIHDAFEGALGVPPARVQSSLLSRAEKAVVGEAHGRGDGGVTTRQPALSQFVAGLVQAPPVPLPPDEQVTLGLALLAVTYALDEMATGRQVP